MRAVEFTRYPLPISSFGFYPLSGLPLGCEIDPARGLVSLVVHYLMVHALLSFVLWFSLFCGLASARPDNSAGSAPLAAPVLLAVEAGDKGFPVLVWNRSLAQFRAALDFPDPQSRAAAARARIEFLLKARELTPLRVQYTELFGQAAARFYAGPHLVFALSAADVNPATNETLGLAASRTEQRLRQLAADYAEHRSLARTLRSVGEVGGVLLLFAFFWLAVVRLRAVTISRLQARLGRPGQRFRYWATTWGGCLARWSSCSVVCWHWA
jgi:hypothetical protein